MENATLVDKKLKTYLAPVTIAKFYGFCPTVSPSIIKLDLEGTKGYDEAVCPHEFAAIIRNYTETRQNILPQPILEWMDRPFPGSGERKRPMRLEGSLLSIGSTKPICECLSIEAALSLLASLGYKDLEVRLNSIGDKDSAQDFEKKTLNYLKKSMATFPPDLRNELKKDHFALIKSQKEEWLPFRGCSPKPLDFLTEVSRLHFKEILEFLEIRNIPYSINDSLIVDPKFASEAVIAIVTKDGEEVARGIRVNRLAKKLGHKKEVPLFKLDISVKLKKAVKEVKDKSEKPRFYLIQFGPEAKLKSFLVLHELYRAQVPLIHSIVKDKLGSQIGVAESSGIPYIILLGQKEALENSVVLRNAFTRAQEIVPISQLADKVKSL
jgi:histidyl-tRNA synthetase